MASDNTFDILQILVIMILILCHQHVYGWPFGEDSYFWNSSHTAEDWGAYQVRVCGRECQNNTLVYKYGPGYCVSPTCFPCDCEKHCSLLGTCCPKLNTDSNTYYNDIETSLDKNPLQWYKRLQCWIPYDEERGFVSVVGCPLSWSDQEMRKKCEHPVRDSMDSVTPFSDRTTRLVFPNAHCAKCHGRQLQTPNKLDKLMDGDETEEKLVAYPWRIKIGCHQYQDLYHITDMFEFFLEASRSPDCRVTFEPSVNRNEPFPCPFKLHTSPPSRLLPPRGPQRPPPRAPPRGPLTAPPRGITTTLDRGRDTFFLKRECSYWTDPTLEFLCKSLPPYPSLSVRHYKNVFCSMCGSSVPRKYSVCFGPIGPTSPDTMLPPLYLLFNPNIPFSETGTGGGVDECPPGHWRNDEGNCTLAACTPGKILDKDNETCRTVITEIKALGYNISFILVTQSHVRREALQYLDDGIQVYVSNWGKTSKIETEYFSKFCPITNSPTEHREFLEVHVNGYIIANDRASRDDVEQEFLTSILRHPWRVRVANSNVTFSVVSIGRGMASIRTARLKSNHAAMSSLDGSISTCKVEKYVFSSPTRPSRTRMIYEMDNYLEYVLERKERFVDINPTLSCPFVAFDSVISPHQLENGSLVFTVCIRDENKTLIQDSTMSFVGGKLLLCLDLVKELTAGDGSWSESSSPDNILLVIQTYIDIVCTSVSVACLVVSFITYCLFPSLRALPGLNNMCLCASLATAQTSLLITAIYGVRGRLNEIHCLIHAVVLHYSWLASFFWMNTCSIHMYRVFTSTRAINTWSVRKTHCRYCLYSFGIPLVLVFSTIIITSTTTGGDSIGYNDTICFLDVFTSTLTTILALLVPAALTVVVNIFLFGLTVREIVNVTRLQPSTRGSQGVMTYIKLSTVTGAFCAVAAAAVLSQIQVLMIVASPLGALMGFFIFVSFIFKRDVGKMYWVLFRGSVDRNHSYVTSDSRKQTGRTAICDTNA